MDSFLLGSLEDFLAFFQGGTKLLQGTLFFNFNGG